MSRWHLTVEDGDNNIVGLFDVGSDQRRDYIENNLPDDLSIRNEKFIDDEADLDNSLQDLSDSLVDWDDRLNDV